MKSKLFFLLILAGCYSKSEQPEIVQIDTGNPITYNDVLRMNSTNEIYHPHGEQMAANLHNQLILLKETIPVPAIQLPWNFMAIGGFNGLLDAIIKAIELNPKVISMSLAGLSPDLREQYLMEQAGKNGILVVAAAGNHSTKLEMHPTGFPAGYNLPCLLAVGTLKNGERAAYSNKAVVWLEEVSTDVPGTSSSTARMAAIALNAWRQLPEANCVKVKEVLVKVYGNK